MSISRQSKRGQRGKAEQQPLHQTIAKPTPQERSAWMRLNVIRLDAALLEDMAVPLLRAIRKLTERYADGSGEAISQAECIAVHRLAEVVEDYIVDAAKSLQIEAGPRTAEAVA